jgi:hypothetical protein
MKSCYYNVKETKFEKVYTYQFNNFLFHYATFPIAFNRGSEGKQVPIPYKRGFEKGKSTKC